VVALSKPGHFLHHLLLLIDFYRINAIVSAFVSQLFHGIPEGFIQKGYLRIQKILKAEQNWHIHPALPDTRDNVHDADT